MFDNTKITSSDSEFGAVSPLFISSDKFVGFNPKTFEVYHDGEKIPLSELQILKDRKQENFLESSYIFSSSTHKEALSLKLLLAKREEQQKAETQNLINSIIEFALYKDLEMVFVTTTLHANLHKPKNLSDIKRGHEAIKKFYNEVRKDKLFREPTPELMQKLGVSKPWKYISTKDELLFIRMKEFHKDWTLHDHTILFVPHALVLDVMALLYRKRERFKKTIGRIEIVLSSALKKEVLDASKI